MSAYTKGEGIILNPHNYKIAYLMQLTKFLIDNVEKASGVRLSLQLYTQLVAKPQPPVLTGGTTAAAKKI